MRKYKTKKAFTLVELVVTLAILSITAGMGIAIFASALQNYSKASVTSSEQEKALEIETYILRHARVATDVYFITSDVNINGSADYTDHVVPSASAISLEDAVGGVVTNAANSNIFEYYDLDKADDDTVVKGVTLNVTGVESIEFKFNKQKIDFTEGSNDSFAYLNYKINMEEGYSVSGSVMLYNCKNVVFSHDPGNFVESTSDDTFTVGSEFNTGIAFLKR